MGRVIGCLGDVIFEVGDDKIETPDNVKWSGSVRYAKHERHLTNTILEYTGMDEDKFSFDITLSKFLGVDPLEVIVKLFNYERDGTLLTLVIGSKVYGKYKWVLQKHDTKMETFDNDGNIVRAVINLDLLGFVRRG